MDVPHHWEGWVVGEELGSLSNNGDADCPVDIPVFSRAFCYLISDRHPWHLGGTWRVGMSGKRILHSQSPAPSDSCSSKNLLNAESFQ